VPALAALRTRRRRAGLAGGAVLAVAVLVAAFLAWPGIGGAPTPVPIPGEVPPSASAEASAEASATPFIAPGLVPSYAPGWVPPGFRERDRAVVQDHLGIPGVRVIRTWNKPANGGEAPFIKVVTMPTADLEPGTPVTAGGVTGTYEGPRPDARAARLSWPADPRHSVLLYSNSVMSQADLLRIATSLRPDRDPIVQPLVIGWVPFEHDEYTYSYGGDSPTSWTAGVSLARSAEPTPDNVTVSLGPTASVSDGGKPVEVGGVEGRLVIDDGSRGGNPRQCLVLPQPGGRLLLTVCNYIAGVDGARMPEDQLLRVAGSVDTRMRATTDWLG
ncbi:hypothetical protein, partial [Dactylosporangium fulvum]|uniref:hypothetical protein n=1 Tax=Dactylosporangium fulvum TaxID=53359 RepID=UPI0031D52C42